MPRTRMSRKSVNKKVDVEHVQKLASRLSKAHPKAWQNPRIKTQYRRLLQDGLFEFDFSKVDLELAKLSLSFLRQLETIISMKIMFLRGPKPAAEDKSKAGKKKFPAKKIKAVRKSIGPDEMRARLSGTVPAAIKRNSHCIETFTLDGMSFNSYRSIARELKSCSKLRTVTMRNCDLSGGRLTAFSSCLSSLAIQGLDLVACELSEKDARVLGKLISDHGCRRDSLYWQQGLRDYSERKNKQQEFIYTNKDTFMLGFVVVDFSGNPLGDEGVRTVCDSLTGDKWILSVNLADTSMTLEGLKAVKHMLGMNKTVMNVSVGSSSKFKKAEEKALAAEIKKILVERRKKRFQEFTAIKIKTGAKESRPWWYKLVKRPRKKRRSSTSRGGSAASSRSGSRASSRLTSRAGSVASSRATSRDPSPSARSSSRKSSVGSRAVSVNVVGGKGRGGRPVGERKTRLVVKMGVPPVRSLSSQGAARSLPSPVRTVVDEIFEMYEKVDFKALIAENKRLVKEVKTLKKALATKKTAPKPSARTGSIRRTRGSKITTAVQRPKTASAASLRSRRKPSETKSTRPTSSRRRISVNLTGRTANAGGKKTAGKKGAGKRTSVKRVQGRKVGGATAKRRAKTASLSKGRSKGGKTQARGKAGKPSKTKSSTKPVTTASKGNERSVELWRDLVAREKMLPTTQELVPRQESKVGPGMVQPNSVQNITAGAPAGAGSLQAQQAQRLGALVEYLENAFTQLHKCMDVIEKQAPATQSSRYLQAAEAAAALAGAGAGAGTGESPAESGDAAKPNLDFRLAEALDGPADGNTVENEM